MADGGDHSLAELRKVVSEQLAQTEDDLRAQIPSGMPLLANRLHWAVTYLYQAGLLSRPKRGVVRITDRGQKVAAEHPDRVDVRVLSEFQEFVEFKSRTRRPKNVGEPELNDVGSTPREAVAAGTDGDERKPPGRRQAENSKDLRIEPGWPTRSGTIAR